MKYVSTLAQPVWDNFSVTFVHKPYNDQLFRSQHLCSKSDMIVLCCSTSAFVMGVDDGVLERFLLYEHFYAKCHLLFVLEFECGVSRL